MGVQWDGVFSKVTEKTRREGKCRSINFCKRPIPQALLTWQKEKEEEVREKVRKGER